MLGIWSSFLLTSCDEELPSQAQPVPIQLIVKPTPTTKAQVFKSFGGPVWEMQRLGCRNVATEHATRVEYRAHRANAVCTSFVLGECA